MKTCRASILRYEAFTSGSGCNTTQHPLTLIDPTYAVPLLPPPSIARFSNGYSYLLNSVVSSGVKKGFLCGTWNFLRKYGILEC